MGDTHLLVNIYNNNGNSFILKLSVGDNVLKLIITDKSTAEKWKCAYDSSYIENLTRKTGNFKQFTVFVSMLKAGLMKTNDCVYVELLSQEELESRRKKPQKYPVLFQKSRKYLILIYQVEFDKIHYPLPLEYSGAPDPSVLQTTIRRYENEIVALKSEVNQLKSKNKLEVQDGGTLKEIICHLNKENQVLYSEVNKLKNELYEKESNNDSSKIIKKLESQLKKERVDFKERLRLLGIENKRLMSILTKLQRTGRAPLVLNYSSPHFSRSPSRSGSSTRKSKSRTRFLSSGSTSSVDSKKSSIQSRARSTSKTSVESTHSISVRKIKNKCQYRGSENLKSHLNKSSQKRSISTN